MLEPNPKHVVIQRLLSSHNWNGSPQQEECGKKEKKKEACRGWYLVQLSELKIVLTLLLSPFFIFILRMDKLCIKHRSCSGTCDNTGELFKSFKESMTISCNRFPKYQILSDLVRPGIVTFFGVVFQPISRVKFMQ